ncbi:hypothetical protein ABEB36_006717 [Hypothenemus hampei]|uniref:DDE Tnp4 domain-containing protein n=1 Tax=Hypothenemus hampei TaxID=57062 RepID=A0ABD1ERI2_HYPHA
MANRIICYVCGASSSPRAMVRLFVLANEQKQEIAVRRRANLNRPPQIISDIDRICFNCNKSINSEIQDVANDPDCLRLNVLHQTDSSSCLFCNRVEDTSALRQEAQQNDPSFGDESTFSDDEFSAISPISRDQFQDLYIHCVPVSVQEGNVHKNRNISKKNLLTFLCKMKQGLSDDLLRVIFKYSCRQAVHRAISLVRRSLMLDFVPHNLGLASITRAQYIERHVTSFSNELYNPSPENPVAIMIIDGTYAHLEKSSNFQSLHIHGPYYSDSSNNDAAMLRNQLENGMGLREWLNDGDIIIVDRGYRDVLPFLDNLGIEYKMPALLQQGQRQLNTEEANDSRLVTKTRWIVEARNGHIKSVFKFFKGKISIVHAENLGDFYRIAAALLNKYRKPIVMSGADLELARKMLVRSRTPNVLQARLEVDHALRTRHAGWDLTLGVYQLNLAPAYIQDKLQREDLEVFEFDEFLNEPGLIRCRIYSRFRNATKYEVWIGYWLEDVHEEVAEQDGEMCLRDQYLDIIVPVNPEPGHSERAHTLQAFYGSSVMHGISRELSTPELHC